MLILRIKQAQCALADGRLDEAFQLASAPDMRQHRQGQDLAGRLARALLERGQKHLAGGHMAHADEDCRKAADIAGALPEVAVLRQAVLAEAKKRQEQQQRDGNLLAAARQQIHQGQLTLGHKILSQIDHPNAQVLRDELADRRAAIELLTAKAADALKRDDWQEAIVHLANSVALKSADVAVRQLVNQVSQQAMQRATEALNSGRLDLAQSILARLRPLGAGNVETEQLQRVLEQCRSAWNSIEAGRFADAQEIVQRLITQLPSVAWVQAALDDVRQAVVSLRQLRACPLGLLGGVVSPAPIAPPSMPVPAPPPLPVKNMVAEEQLLPERFLIQVDGAGAFAVLRKRQITIGPISSSTVADLPLMTDAQTPTITLGRNDEDYFLSSPAPVNVNESRTSGKLLVNGDRIALSARCRLSFRLPSAASTSAVLDLSSARLARADVRRVILLDRELIIGPGNAHVRCDQMPAPVVLCVRDGALVCQSRSPILIDDKPAAAAAVIGLGNRVTVGDISFVVTRL